VRDDHLAEDIFQEVAASAVQKCDEIRDTQHLLAWVRLTTRRRALKLCRRRRQQCLFRNEALIDLLDEQWAEHDLAPASDLVDALRRCLEELSPYARTLVNLRYAEGISGVRLAEAVGRRLNTVYVALTRIHRSLGDCIRRRLA
jgi:RNA polymerase sigma-70 factor (ECF subfamily)